MCHRHFSVILLLSVQRGRPITVNRMYQLIYTSQLILPYQLLYFTKTFTLPATVFTKTLFFQDFLFYQDTTWTRTPLAPKSTSSNLFIIYLSRTKTLLGANGALSRLYQDFIIKKLVKTKFLPAVVMPNFLLGTLGTLVRRF